MTNIRYAEWVAELGTRFERDSTTSRPRFWNSFSDQVAIGAERGRKKIEFWPILGIKM